MDGISAIALNAAGGGLLGFLGSLANRGFLFFEKKEDRKHERAKWEERSKEREHEMNLLSQAEKMRADEREDEFLITQERGSREGLIASYAAQNALAQAEKGSPWVIDVLRLVRPFLTILLVILTAIYFLFTRDASIIEETIFSASTALLWWFGDRTQVGGNAAGRLN